jgi:hypothetical protein
VEPMLLIRSLMQTGPGQGRGNGRPSQCRELDLDAGNGRGSAIAVLNRGSNGMARDQVSMEKERVTKEVVIRVVLLAGQPEYIVYELQQSQQIASLAGESVRDLASVLDVRGVAIYHPGL